MKKIVILNGPNLNLVGRREPAVYGMEPIGDFLLDLCKSHDNIDIIPLQSNHEGQLIDWIQQYGYDTDVLGIIINAGAYTHTSLAIADAVAAIDVPVIEVHLSNIYAREEIRHHSFISPVARGVIAGLGLYGYTAALNILLSETSSK